VSLLAAVIDWDRELPDVGTVGALLSAFPTRSRDGRWFARTPHAALGLGRTYVRKADRIEVQPLKDDRRGVCAVGDLRFDNRDDLRRTLSNGQRSPSSDIELLVAGYERWGAGLVEHLVGDFAFVLWDWRNRRVFAARDPFGVRPLVYRNSGGRLVFATDAAQFLALTDTDRTPDAQTVVDVLSWSHAHYGKTFFRGISSLCPGHYLWAGESGAREVEYFRPPDTPTAYRRTEDYHEHFRALFKQAVQDRLDSDYPIVAHLSGGLDSSSIVCQANQIYGDHPGAFPPLITASALFPGQPHDEEPFVDAVSQSVNFPSRRWDGNAPSGWEFSRPALGIPGSSVHFNGGSVGDVEIASAAGSRVMLSGEGGDFVTGELGLYEDLLKNFQWRTLYGQISAPGSRTEKDTRIVLLKRAVRELVPRTLVTIWDLKNPKPSARPPAWLQRDLNRLWIDRRAWIPPDPRRWLSRVQRGAWAYLTMPVMAWALDHAAAYGADRGIEFRYPFLDSRLVNFVLSIPFEHRLVGGCSRWLHRQALRPILPAAIADRTSKPGFTRAVVEWGRRSRASIQQVVGGAQWLSARFVNQVEVQRLLVCLASRPPNPVRDWDDWRDIRSIVNIEVWHKAVLEYSTTKEILPMVEVSSLDEKAPQEGDKGKNAAEARQALSYVAPKLVNVGNVNQLLAASPGSGVDGGVVPGVTHP
jgi:asparagine synthase (glutamine-hydrolysing)